MAEREIEDIDVVEGVSQDGLCFESDFFGHGQHRRRGSCRGIGAAHD